MKHDVIIIAAGLAGLTAAHELERNGYRCLILEKGQTPGGRVQSTNEHGLTIDWVAGFFAKFYQNID